MKHFARYWLPVIVWSALILATSTDLFSLSHSGSILATLFGRMLSARQIDIANIVFRKLMHLTGYGILGALGFRAANGAPASAGAPPAKAGAPFLVGILIAAFVGSIDEWHQTFVPSRGGSAYDVLIDTLGAVIAQIVIAARNARR